MENKLSQKSSKSALGNTKALYQKFLAEKAEGELDKALEKVDKIQ